MTIESLCNPPVDPTRRRFLSVAAGGAVAAAIPIAVLADTPALDPVFDLIDIHRKAHAAHLAAIKEADRLGESWSGITEQPCVDENDAFEILVGAAATTLPGILAKLDYLRELAEQEAWMLDEREGVALLLADSIVTSLRNAGVLS